MLELNLTGQFSISEPNDTEFPAAAQIYTPCVRGYAPPTKKWQNYWSIPESKCLKAFLNFLKEELDRWSKSKFSVTS